MKMFNDNDSPRLEVMRKVLPLSIGRYLVHSGMSGHLVMNIPAPGDS